MQLGPAGREWFRSAAEVGQEVGKAETNRSKEGYRLGVLGLRVFWSSHPNTRSSLFSSAHLRPLGLRCRKVSDGLGPLSRFLLQQWRKDLPGRLARIVVRSVSSAREGTGMRPLDASESFRLL